ncbi:hypothetical protein [Nocardiopsis tropica]|uniref:Alkaline shock response membrane anchor protein AmaP n=1 Tax=Nocardiopsis tropica TaxID=109330 RepID=A0ABV1ZMY3_9ACTN
MEENGALREVPPGGVAEQDGPSPGPTASTIRGFPHKGARRTARGNRLGLVLTGLPLVLCGAAGLAAGGGLLGGATAAAPVGGGPLETALAWPWTPYVVAAVALVVTVSAVRWLLVQGRSNRAGRLRVGEDTASGRTGVPASAAGDAVVAEACADPRVRRGRAHFTESSREPRLWLDLVLTEDADPADVWRTCRDGPVASLRESLELERLPTVVRMSVSGRSGGRGLA